jgi:YD repeat-containing protein
MKPIAALALFSFFSPSASADVNMLDASFRQTFIDAKVAGLNIERKYDSRSSFIGVFGFGWCSTFDIELETQTLKLKECGRTTANKVVYVKGRYLLRTKGLTRTFDADSGALIALKSDGGAEVEIQSDTRSRLHRAAALGEGMKMRLEFDALQENITALILPDSKRLTFTYSKSRDLLEATNAWSNTYRFEYNTLHNLTSVRYPDSTEELISYDDDRDRLTKYQGRDGCIETYDHTTSQSKAERTQISTARLMCDERLRRQVVFRFGFIRKNSQWLLNSFDRGVK